MAACHKRGTVERVLSSCGVLGHHLCAHCGLSEALPELRRRRSQLIILEDASEAEAAALTERVCRELRDRYRGRAVYLLVIAEELSHGRELAMLREGADYYIAPLEGARLAGYVHTLVGRALELDRQSVEVEGVVLEAERRSVTVNGKPLQLTRTEFDILFRLATARGRVVSLSEVTEQVLNVADNAASRACVRQHVYTVGKKCAYIGGMIQTVHRLGYVLEPPNLRNAAYSPLTAGPTSKMPSQRTASTSSAK